MFTPCRPFQALNSSPIPQVRPVALNVSPSIFLSHIIDLQHQHHNEPTLLFSERMAPSFRSPVREGNSSLLQRKKWLNEYWEEFPRTILALAPLFCALKAPSASIHISSKIAKYSVNISFLFPMVPFKIIHQLKCITWLFLSFHSL